MITYHLQEENIKPTPNNLIRYVIRRTSKSYTRSLYSMCAYVKYINRFDLYVLFDIMVKRDGLNNYII